MSTTHQSGPPEPGRLEAAELADLYAAGALTPAEQHELESRLAAGDVQLRRELERVRPVLELLLNAEAVDPPRHMREGIEARVEAEFERSARESDQALSAASHAVRRQARDGGEDTGDAFVVVRQDEGRWLPTGIRGLRIRRLASDRRANRRTILLQMDPGTEFPDHDHAGLEEVIVLSGDLRIGSEVLRPGDYFRVGPGVRHATPTTETGCVCMIVSGYMPFPMSSWISIAWQVVRGWFSRQAD